MLTLSVQLEARMPTHVCWIRTRYNDCQSICICPAVCRHREQRFVNETTECIRHKTARLECRARPMKGSRKKSENPKERTGGAPPPTSQGVWQIL